jgi:hypothetical protein
MSDPLRRHELRREVVDAFSRLTEAGWMAHWLDVLYTEVIGEGLLFPDGWGDVGVFHDLATFIRSTGEPAAVDPVLEPTRDPPPGVTSWEGSFTSPSPGLPDASRRACFRLSVPTHQPDAPVCVLLAANGEQGYSQRQRAYIGLVPRGLGLLLLENPWYGRRRPAGQSGSVLRTVGEQFRMSHAAVEEAVVLLSWLRRRGQRAVGVSGYSMGGAAAACAAIRCDFPVIAIPMAMGARTAASVERFLGRQIRWSSLGDPDHARRRMVELMELLDLTSFRAPTDPSRAHLVGFTDDGWVDRDNVRTLHRHWPGSRLSWLEGGHVSGMLFRTEVLREIVAGAFGLESTHRAPSSLRGALGALAPLLFRRKKPDHRSPGSARAKFPANR